MIQSTSIRCLMVAGVLAFATSSMWAQTGTKSDSSTTTTQKTTAKKFRGRLPNNYGQIGLDPKQKEAIYAIQERYHTEIEELEQRLAELKMKQAEDIYEILAPEQKKKLAELRSKRKTSPKPTTTTAGTKPAPGAE